MSKGNSSKKQEASSTNILPLPAKVYILLVILAGVSVFAFSLYCCLLSADHQWLYVAGFTIAASCFVTKIPLLKGPGNQSLSITVGGLFIFISLFFFGPMIAAILAMIEGLISSFRVRVKKPYKYLFNGSQLTLVAFIAGQAFQKMHATVPGFVHATDLTVFLEAGLCGVVYFLLNSSAVALAIALASGQHFVGLWKQNFFVFSVSTMINQSSAAAIFVYFRPISSSIVLTVIPLVLVFYYARRMRLRSLTRA
jgi:hypothetical protein